jgi:hypothetical protein
LSTSRGRETGFREVFGGWGSDLRFMVVDLGSRDTRFGDRVQGLGFWVPD